MNDMKRPLSNVACKTNKTEWNFVRGNVRKKTLFPPQSRIYSTENIGHRFGYRERTSLLCREVIVATERETKEGRKRERDPFFKPTPWPCNFHCPLFSLINSSRNDTYSPMKPFVRPTGPLVIEKSIRSEFAMVPALLPLPLRPE